MKISSTELWDSLEVKLLDVSKKIEHVDYLLSDKITSLVNHFNGNMARTNHVVCIDDIGMIVNNLNRKGYFKDRKYSKEETVLARSIVEDLSLIQKVMLSEHKDMIMAKRESKPIVKEERLPNIGNDRAMDMFKSK